MRQDYRTGSTTALQRGPRIERILAGPMKLALFLCLACVSSLAASPIDFITFGNRALIGGFGTTQILGAAQANYDGYTGTVTPPVSLSFQADAVGYTTGPVRPGLLELSAYGGGTAGTGSGLIGDSHLFCAEFGCMPHGDVVLPFTLGTEFLIHVEAYAHNFQGEGGSGEIQFNFSLHDYDYPRADFPPRPGNAVVIYNQPEMAHMPEPSTWGMLAIGVGCLLLQKFRQQ
jgi:hypothetical protein